MSKKITLVTLLLLSLGNYYAVAQNKFLQYFDGADTTQSSIKFTYSPATKNNIWQIGKPKKAIFNMAATLPNVMVTDTVNNYPSRNTSSFAFHFDLKFPGSVYALRWKQKLDMDKHKDGGIIEFSFDNGVTWQNGFNNPLSNNFYGFDPSNKDTLASGEYAFSGTDSTWRDIWFCIFRFSGSSNSPIDYRFTFKSDGVDNQKEGWMIDNLMAYQTSIHIVKDNEKSDYLTVYPTATKGAVKIEASKIQDNHAIELVQLYGGDGRLVQEFQVEPTRLDIDISHLPDGIYYLMIITNLKHEVFPLMLTK